jgi:hypothetical protein
MKRMKRRWKRENEGKEEECALVRTDTLDSSRLTEEERERERERERENEGKEEECLW